MLVFDLPVSAHLPAFDLSQSAEADVVSFVEVAARVGSVRPLFVGQLHPHRIKRRDKVDGISLRVHVKLLQEIAQGKDLGEEKERGGEKERRENRQ